MRLALYAHYNSRGDVARFVMIYLQALRELGFEVHFISNSPLSPEAYQELAAVCGQITERPNSGFDFSMWQTGLASLDFAHYDEILLTNSSIVGPLRPLQVLWDAAAAMDCDFWGVTENDEYAAHLQSYFLVFRRAVLRADSFRSFWNCVVPYSDKMQVVRSYEVGLTIWLQQNGFRGRAIFPTAEIGREYSSRRGIARRVVDRCLFRTPSLVSNPALRCPELLVEMGMPFLKASHLDHGSPFMPRRAALYLLRNSEFPAAAVGELDNLLN